MTNFLEEIFLLIDKMVQINKNLRQEVLKAMEECSEKMDSHCFAKEHGTVRFSVGRRGGKTEYIKARATTEDCVVAISRDVVERIYGKDLKTNFLFVEDASEIREYKNIYIEVNMLNGVNLNWVYDRLAMTRDQTFIILG